MNSNCIILSNCQQKAYKDVMDFLSKDEKSIILQGISGTGKSVFINHLNSVIPSYGMNVIVTATTNKAASQLNCDAITIHKFTETKVRNRLDNGKTFTVCSNDFEKLNDFPNTLLIIDECSMINKQMYNTLTLLLKKTFNFKILFVGDKNQLPPIGEPLSLVYRQGFKEINLLEIQRGKNLKNIIDLNLNALKYVKNEVDYIKIEESNNIKFVKPSIENKFTKDLIIDKFKNEEKDSVMLCYTNKQVDEYNFFIRRSKELPDYFIVGDKLVNNISYDDVSVGSIVSICSIKPFSLEELKYYLYSKINPTKINLNFMKNHINFFIKELSRKEILFQEVEVNIYNKLYSFKIPIYFNKLKSLMNEYANKKKWFMYFFLQENIPELRFKYAMTVHKSQGSSFKNVFINLDNIQLCKKPEERRKLVYVSLTRSLENIYILTKERVINEYIAIGE